MKKTKTRRTKPIGEQTIQYLSVSYIDSFIRIFISIHLFDVTNQTKLNRKKQIIIVVRLNTKKKTKKSKKKKKYMNIKENEEKKNN